MRRDADPQRGGRRPRRVALASLLLALLVGIGVAVGLARPGGVAQLFAPEAGPGPPTSSQLGPISGEERTALPDRSLPSFGDAAPVELQDYRGKPLLINFWATWCVPCLEEMPILRDVSRQVQGEVNFLGVNVQDNERKARALLRELDVTYDQARDPAAAFFTEVNGFGMPTTLLVDPSGVITYRHTGAVTSDQLRDLLARHLGVQP